MSELLICAAKTEDGKVLSKMDIINLLKCSRDRGECPREAECDPECDYVCNHLRGKCVLSEQKGLDGLIVDDGDIEPASISGLVEGGLSYWVNVRNLGRLQLHGLEVDRQTPPMPGSAIYA